MNLTLGIVFFGIGAGMMGRYGAFAAFPMMLVMAILFGNPAGIVTGVGFVLESSTR